MLLCQKKKIINNWSYGKQNVCMYELNGTSTADSVGKSEVYLY
jgi:hypothetical protein